MEIDEKIIENATKCEKHFACLNNKHHKCCEIHICITDEICVIRHDEAKNSCNYCTCSGYSQVCHCPVRVEIYNKYKK